MGTDGWGCCDLEAFPKCLGVADPCQACPQNRPSREASYLVTVPPHSLARQHWIQQTFFSLPLTFYHNRDFTEQPMVTPKLQVLMMREGVGKRERKSKGEGGRRERTEQIYSANSGRDNTYKHPSVRQISLDCCLPWIVFKEYFCFQRWIVKNNIHHEWCFGISLHFFLSSTLLLSCFKTQSIQLIQ